MQIRSVTPAGILTVFNLDHIPVWRLELGTAQSSLLGVGVRYIVGDAPHWGWVCALDCLTTGNELVEIVRKGLARKDAAKDKELLQESMKILFNADGLKPAQVDELIQKSSGLVEAYHQILTAVRTGSEAHGAYEGWDWSVGAGTW